MLDEVCGALLGQAQPHVHASVDLPDPYLNQIVVEPLQLKTVFVQPVLEGEMPGCLSDNGEMLDDMRETEEGCHQTL
jgi:hypothetical protein